MGFQWDSCGIPVGWESSLLLIRDELLTVAGREPINKNNEKISKGGAIL